MNTRRRIHWADLGPEPYRALFPAAVLAGIIGAALWPLHFANLVSLYPGQAHARLMSCGLLGGFIFGFLGTAMPRMLSAPPFKLCHVTALLSLHLAMLLCYAIQKTGWGDYVFLLELLFFMGLLVSRFKSRADMPPPGFILVALALLCALGGAVIGVVEQHVSDLDAYWPLLRRLLLYQGFLLLPVLGIGPFLLPRFFGLEREHAMPEMLRPTPAWLKKAGAALLAGLVVVASLFVEANGWHRAAHLVRFGATLAYFAVEFPFRRARSGGGVLGMSLWVSCGVLLGGFFVIALYPAYRVGLLHLALIGGFATVAFVVATRVIYGHSGNLDQLKKPNRWFLWVVGFMLLATATRASADIWPAITQSHYIYGALAWIAAALLWSWHTLPKIFERDE